MSVRAYKIIRMVIAERPTFNCWSDEFIMDIADLSRYSDGGTIELERSEVENLIEEIKEDLAAGKKNFRSYDISPKDALAIATATLKDFKKGEDYQQYDCY